MSMWSRVKSWAGGGRLYEYTINVADGGTGTMYLPDDSNVFTLVGPEGSVGISKIFASGATRNRKVYLYQKYDASITPETVFTNTDGASVEGEMDLGGSDVTLGATDVLALLLRPDGTWVRIFTTDN